MSQSNKINKEFGSVSSTFGSVQVVNGTGALGAISLSKQVSHVKAVGASTGTLADGHQGQMKTIVMTLHGGDYVLTPANLYGANSTITFTAVSDAVQLVFLGSDWYVISATATVA